MFPAEIWWIFAVAFVIHAILNILVNKGPKVVIDEGLYTNIARSLAWKGELAFRGQPINYPYLLYPCLLVPIYWLNRLLGGDVYRYVQVFNTLLITSSVLPAYAFAHDYTKNKSKSLSVALIVVLMPDMLFGGFEMAECVLWPLALWLVFFCYRYYQTNKLSYGIATALFTGMMFAAKPGAIAVGATLLTGKLLASFRDKKRLKQTLISLGSLLMVVATVYGIYLLLYHSGDSILGLYTKQTEEWKAKDVFVAIEAVFLLAFLFIFACGGVFGLLPFVRLKECDSDKRQFTLSLAAGILVAIIGTAVFVVPYKWTGELGNLPMHLRYCSMYIPAIVTLAFDRDRYAQSNKALGISLLILIALSVFPGVRAGFVAGKSGYIDSITLGAFVRSSTLNGVVTGWLLSAFTIVFLSAFAVDAFRKKKEAKQKGNIVQTVGTTFLLVFVLFNALCGHLASNIYIAPSIAADALEVNRMIKSKDCLGITQQYYDDIYSYWLDGRLNVPMQQVTIDQMFIETQDNRGIYTPFIPVAQSPNLNTHETPQTDTFVLGMTIAEHLELSDTTSAVRTKNGHFTVVEITSSERWVDTMMYGLDDNALYDGKTGYIEVFDENRNIDGNLVLNVTAYGRGILHVGNQQIAVEAEEKTYQVTLPFTNTVVIRAEGGTVMLVQYTTEKVSAQ